MPKIRYRRLVRTPAHNNITKYTETQSLLTVVHLCLRGQKKNVAQGRFEYSHSPDNRALTKPYPVTTYLVANY